MLTNNSECSCISTFCQRLCTYKTKETELSLSGYAVDMKEQNHLPSDQTGQNSTCNSTSTIYINLVLGCSCYFLSVQSGSWGKGRQDCRARGADLVIIDSLKEQEFLTKDIVKQESWIGLTDRNNEMTWKWIDGTPLTLKFWQKGQPDKGNGNPKWGEEDCAVIQPGMKADENWNDLRCDASRPWICGKAL
uniref:C-type lectin domain-containing protein n=1 Tax=Seriola dumerili TaxID=41447 RepID=A0A3B4UNM5_SERDU